MDFLRRFLRKYFLVYALVIGLFIGSATLMDRTVTALAEAMPVPRSVTVVIDPGHGGEDGGAVSCTGALESQINLEISLRLNDLLQFLGYDTKMTRRTDVSVYTQGTTLSEKKISDLKQRVSMVNETPDALLLSIHQNQFTDGKYSGAQVFYASTAGSHALAEQTQAQLISALNPGSSRTCKPANGVYLMEHIACTGILVECGFLSNPQEEASLRTPEYQKKLCCVIATAAAQYLEAEQMVRYG